MEFTRRGGQHDMAGTPPGRLQRSHGDEVAVERSGRLPRYKAETSDIKSANGRIHRGEHQRARAFSFLLAPEGASSAPHRAEFLLNSAFHAESGGEEYKK